MTAPTLTVNYYRNSPIQIVNFLVVFSRRVTRKGVKITRDVLVTKADGRVSEVYMQFNKGTAFAKMVDAVKAPSVEQFRDITENGRGALMVWESGYITVEGVNIGYNV